MLDDDDDDELLIDSSGKPARLDQTNQTQFFNLIHHLESKITTLQQE